MIKTILLAIMLLVASSAIATAENAPSIWMEQEGDIIKLMVNTSDNSMGSQAHVHFDETQINITDVDISMSPWIALSGPGWSHQGNYVIIAQTNFTDVGTIPGEYQMAELSVDCIVPGETSVTLTDIAFEGADLVPTDLTYTCPEIVPPVTDAVIAIGDGTGIVTLPITVTNAGSAGSCDVTLTYDHLSVEVTDVLSGDMEYTYINIADTASGQIRVGAFQGIDPGLDNFTIANIALAPVSGGSTCDLTLTVTTLTDDTPDCADIPYTISSGIYTIVTSGDADGDGTVDFGDVAYIAGYVIGLPGYETIDEDFADVNGDGVVTIADAMYLTKHLLNIAGFENLQ